MKTRAPIVVGFAALGLVLLPHCGSTTSSNGPDAGNDASTGGNGGSATGGTTSGAGGRAGAGNGGTAAGGVAGRANGGGANGGAGNGGAANGGAANGGAAGTAGASGGVSCPVTPAQLADELARAICAKNVDCCAGVQVNSCLITVTDHIQNSVYPQLSASLTANTAAIDCASLTKCIDAIAAAACADWPLGGPLHLPVDEPACLSIITPKIAPGDACTQAYQCEGGYCFTGTGGDNKCHRFAGLNNTCDPTQNTNVQNANSEQRCQTTGEFCNGGNVCQDQLDDGVSCSANYQCKSGNCDATTTKCANPTVCSYDPTTCSFAPGRSSGGLPGSVGVALLALGALSMRRRRA